MNQMEIIAFGGGCFWCTEAIFKRLRGVEQVEPGYVEGVEVAQVTYDPGAVRLDDLLTVFFGSHDPTSIDRQGNDVGPAYRSVIFYLNDQQKLAAEEFINNLNASNKMGAPIVTKVALLTKFQLAEDYHRDFYANNPTQSYCQVVINPKLEKVQAKFSNLLKEQYKK